jgi:hypothetical protein
VNFDFESQDIERQALMAAMLRKQAMESAAQGMPQGQMISGRYVAPHWTQQLASTLNPVLQQAGAGNLENQVSGRKAVLSQAIEKARQDWLERMPQGTPAQPAQMSPEVQGNNPSAYVPPQQTATAAPAQLPSAMERMKWMAEGSRVPGNGPLALTLGKMMESEVTREDTQRARQEQAQLEAQLRLQQKQQELQARLEEAHMRGATQRDLAAMALEGRREIAAMAAGFKSEASEDRKERHAQLSTEKLGNAAQAIAPMVVTGQAVQDMLDRYGSGKSIPGVGYEARLAPEAIKREANVNRATIQRFANAVARSEIGLSQTLSEQAQQALSNMSNGRFSEDEFKAAWPEILAKTNASIDNLYGAYGPTVIDRYNSQGGNLKRVQSKKPQQTPEQRLQELRARKQATQGTVPEGTF